jgi:phosphoglycolate phosphatase-like HAD superfamily hydrolase
MVPEYLVLDFDGVIVDSAEECFERSLEAYANTQLSDVGPGYSTCLRPLFLRYRYLVGPAANFWDLMEAISRCSLKDEHGQVPIVFSALIVDRTQDTLSKRERFISDFFKSRRNKINDCNELWLAQHRMYSQVNSLLSSVDTHNIFIATMKDSESVIELLKYFGIPILNENIFDNQYGSNKEIHIRKVLSQLECDPKNVLFVDDNSNHLKEVSGTGVKLAYASWGYGLMPDPCTVDELKIEVL